jgi:hypothetical protein
MAWQDLGLIFGVTGQRPWMISHGYVPTAIRLQDRIRIFAAFWDADMVGRCGYVDVDAADPTRVLGFSAEPVLDVGAPGAFDEHGVTPMSVVRLPDELRLYYAGWRRDPEVRYRLFTGLAVSRDDGLTFHRHGGAPVLGPTGTHDLVRTGFITRIGDRWQAWSAQSEGLVDLNGKPTPTYGLGFMESSDGLAWPATAEPCLGVTPGDIVGYGRSAVWREASGLYQGLFSVRRIGGYSIEHATSADGRTWSALSSEGLGFPPRLTTPRQAETMFPSLVETPAGRVMFYNGDHFGREGVRAAIWRP